MADRTTYESGPGYDETVSGWGWTQEARTVGRILTERGHYTETEDAFEWHQGDSANVARAIDWHGLSAATVKAALLDTGVHADEDYPDQLCLADDVRAILVALGAASGDETRGGA